MVSTPFYAGSGVPGFAESQSPRTDGHPVDEQTLWHLWRSGGDLEARQALAELHLPYARALAAKTFARRLHDEFEFDDYFHFAVVGMMESLDRYIPNGEAQFRTFATPRMHGAILNGLEKLSERQQQAALQRRLVSERMQSLRERDGRSGEDAMNALLGRLSDIGIGIALGFLLEGTGMVMAREAPQHLADNAYAGVESRELSERLWSLVEQLPGNEGQVLRRHYLQQQPFDAIADALSLSKGRISQIHRQALERLRGLMTQPGRVDVAW